MTVFSASAALLAAACALFVAQPADAATLRWSSQGDPLTMDPHAQNEGLTNSMNGQVYETLLRRGRQLQLQPGLASSWQQTSPLQWRFQLRTGVTFHDGAPLTAQDVVFSVQRVSRQPGVKTTYKKNLAWWGDAAGERPGNVDAIVFTPIANDATRLAALISGQLDVVIDPAPRDVQRLQATPGVQVVQGPENRVLFIGMDQARDKLLYGQVPGDRNPFKDIRVRQALYHAVDIQAIKSRLMNGMAVPTGSLMPSPEAQYNDMSFETRLPFDLAHARRLMAEAGYADGFDVTLDCPNNRYINDEKLCTALAAMWSQIKVRIKVNAQPRALWFPRMEKRDTSMYLLGWGGAVSDAETTFTPVLRSIGEQGQGFYNWGGVSDAKFDQLAAASSIEPDAVKRQALVKAALREYQSQVHLIPLHRQVIPWAVRSTVQVVHRPDNWLEVVWVTVQ